MKFPDKNSPRYFRDYPVLEVYRYSIIGGLLLTILWPVACYLEWVKEVIAKELDDDFD